MRIGENVLRFRLPIGIILILTTAYMVFSASRVKIATDFVEMFPYRQHDVALYNQYRSYGEAQTVALMLQVKHGDIFNYTTLKKIQDINNAMDLLPRVNHNEVFSLASVRASYADAVSGGIAGKNYMYPLVPTTKEDIEQLKREVIIHRDQLRHLVSADYKSALITAAFNEEGLDYKDLFNQMQGIVAKYQDADHAIFIAGEPIVRGYGYYYEPRIRVIFLAAVGTMLVILYIVLAPRSDYWWAPIITGSCSAIWGFGFVGMMGYNFDPLMLVIPFILTARDMSHGIQWQGRYHDEFDRLRDKYEACVATTDYMLPPGFLSIVADIAGIIFIAFGGIPVLTHVAIAGSVWLAASLTMVFIFQPIIMSYLPEPRSKQARADAGVRRFAWAQPLLDWIINLPITRGPARSILMLGAAAFLVWGIVSGARAQIGYNSPGTPLYRPTSKVNVDLDAIGKQFPIDEGWVIVTTPTFPSPQCVLGPSTMRMMDDMRAYLLERGLVRQVISISSTLIKPFNQMLHYGHPKFYSMPDNTRAAGILWTLVQGGAAPGEAGRYVNNNQFSDTPIRLLLRDHTYNTLNDIQTQIATFITTRVKPNPELSQVSLDYLGGIAGLYAGANAVLYQLDFINITFVLGVVFIFCAISFRSFVAAGLFFTACVLANFGAFIYMRLRDIGLTIDTIPVISLGIGLGVDYGIYTVARIRDEALAGMPLEEAITLALRTTGASVFSTFAVMVGGIVPWAFSPALFHSEMSILLMVLMATNMVAGVLILPSVLALTRPKFVVGDGSLAAGAAESAPAARQQVGGS